MKTIIFSLLFVAALFPQGNPKLLQEFKKIHSTYWEYQEGDFMGRLQGWQIHGLLSKMRCEGDENKAYLEIVRAVVDIEQLAQAAAAANTLFEGTAKVVRFQDVKSLCYVSSTVWKNHRTEMTKTIGPIIGKCRPELQDIYRGLVAIDTEDRMLEFYNKYLKDLK